LTVAVGQADIAVAARVASIEATLCAIRACQSPLLIHCNALGDHLLMRPTVLALQHVLDGRASYAGATGMVEQFYGDAGLRATHNIAFLSSTEESHTFDINEILSLRGSFDAIISLNWWDSAQLRELSTLDGIPFLALSKNYGFVDPIGPGEHVADYSFRLAKLFDPHLDINRFVSLPEPSLAVAKRVEQLVGLLPPHRQLLGIHTLTRKDKQWDRDKFKELLTSFLLRHDDFVAVVLDQLDDDLDGGPCHDRICALEGVDLTTSTHLLARCDAFVGIDSYFLHVADFCRIPSVGIFGPTSPLHWGLRFARCRHVTGSPAASIDVGEVMDALSAVIVPD
jgi:hypothetical protein